MTHQSDVIVVTAHPDDEIFVSGTMCLCAEKRFDITLVCATYGDGGSRELLYADSRLDLGAVRRQELALPAWALGVNEVLFLGQADVAAPETAGAPGAWDQPGVIAALGRIMEQKEPALILTHGPLGGYGHAAHRLLHRCVVEAAEKTSFSGSIFSFARRSKTASSAGTFLDQPARVGLCSGL